MKKLMSIFWIALFAPMLILSSCKKDDDDDDTPPPPTTGDVKGVVSNGSTGDALEGVRIVLFNANSNEPTGMVDVSDSSGAYNFKIAGGSYYVKVTQQGFEDVPAKGLPGLAFTITNGSVTTNNIEMFANSNMNLGWISGELTSNDTKVDGALVVASDGTDGYSTISDTGGFYIIYNVPMGTYDVKAWRAEMSSTNAAASVSANTETANIDLMVNSATGSNVNGAITFLATSNSDVDVSLTHPESEESIPGLSTFSSSGSYSMSGVPDGTFLARASYANDGIVIDPDWIVKNGEPFVTVSGGAATRDFSVTGAVPVVSPTNPPENSIPVYTSSTPTFEWTKYSSTSDYVIEVSDANGNVMWGGFSNNWTVKNIIIPSSQNSIVYNSDGNATGPLEVGKVYRWKIYASKDAQSTTGWELISVSEDQRGLIVIQ